MSDYYLDPDFGGGYGLIKLSWIIYLSWIGRLEHSKGDVCHVNKKARLTIYTFVCFDLSNEKCLKYLFSWDDACFGRYTYRPAFQINDPSSKS